MISFSERHYLIENEPDYDPENYAHPALNTPPGFYPESGYSDSEDDTGASDASQDDAAEDDAAEDDAAEDDAAENDAAEDDPSEEDSSADDASEANVNADDAGEHDSTAQVSTVEAIPQRSRVQPR